MYDQETTNEILKLAAYQHVAVDSQALSQQTTELGLRELSGVRGANGPSILY
jgi:hypothetical protein